MVDIASLAIKIDTSDAARAGQELDKLAGAGKKAETAAGGVARAWDDAAQAVASTATPAKAVSAALTQNNAALRLNASVMERAGLSAGQYQQALRTLPMQLTDVTVSLASGMPLWMVAIQQGGQIRDSFGGIGNAARAVVSTLGPLNLAFGGVAATLGALLLAYQQGQNEAQAYQQALILTGNAAGTSADQLANMAQDMDEMGGTQRQAAEALAEVAATGKVAADQIQLVAQSAIDMERATGRAVSETVKEFSRLADEPAAAAAKLNEQYNFLTASVYEQIRALEEQGRTTEAAKLATDTYAAAVQQRAAQVEGSLGLLQRGWRSVTSAAAEAWDAMLNVGRPDTLEEQLAGIEERLRNARSRTGLQASRTDTSELEQQREELQLAILERDAEAERAGVRTKANQESIDAQKEIARIREQGLSKSEQKAKAIADYMDNIEKIRSVNPFSSLLDQAQIDKDLAAIDAKYKETTRKTKAYTDDAATRMLQQLREQEASLRAQVSGSDKLTATQRAQVEFAQKIADLKGKAILTAEQKSLLANQGAITAQLAENVALEDQIRKREQLTELERIRISILRDSGQTEAANAAQFELDFAQRRLEYERQGNTEAIKRLDTLRQIQEANSRASLPTGTIEGVSQAPSADGISPSVGGASAEMIRLEQDRMALENWRIMELEKQTAFLEAKAINEEVYAERVRNINEQSAENLGSISSAMFSAQLGAAEDLVGNIAGLAAQAAGEQSGLYKVMFAAQKAFAIAQTIVNAEMASAAALAPPPIGLGPIAGLPYSQVIRGMGYASAAVIGAQALAGMAHDGIDSVPREGTWLLDKGERVVDSRTNQDLKQYLSGQQQGAGGMNVVVNNYSNSRVETQRNRSGELEVVIRAVEDRLVGGIAAGDSRLGTVMERSYGMQRQGR